MYKFLKPLLFLLSPERAHALTGFFIHALDFISFLPRFLYVEKNEKLKRTVFGIEFQNPVGLAAGFDKDAKLYSGLANFGFGFIEIGTVTPKPQQGNPKPRLFRMPQEHALINMMGFNNDGVEKAAYRLKNRNKTIIIGGNIGKNKDTPNKNAIDDYILCFEKLFDYVDYFVVNVSSPNTPGLRELQDKEPLKNILFELQKANNKKPLPKPVLIKISPDLSNEQLDDIAAIVKETKIDGVIATNTTINFSNLKTGKSKSNLSGGGGLSGKPLCKRSTEVISYLAGKSEKTFFIIGTGGIHSPEDAIEKLNAGADLIQIYTGFIYEGPGLIKRINKAIIKSQPVLI